MPALTLPVFVQLSRESVSVATSAQTLINNNAASDFEMLRIAMFGEKPQPTCKNKTQRYRSALLTLRLLLNLVFDLSKPNERFTLAHRNTLLCHPSPDGQTSTGTRRAILGGARCASQDWGTE